MWRVVRVAMLAVGACLLLWIGSGWWKNSGRDAAFERLQPGDTEAQVVAQFGKPEVVELPSEPFLRYATRPCTTPCSVRLWWEDALLPGVRAWSVELGLDRRVVHTSRWVSP